MKQIKKNMVLDEIEIISQTNNRDLEKINEVLSAFWLDVKRSVDFCLDNKFDEIDDWNSDETDSNEGDVIYSWQQVVNNAIWLDGTAISLIKMDPIKSRKFFLFFTSFCNFFNQFYFC